MGNYNRDNRSEGRQNYGRRDFGGRGEDRPMFKAICSKCGRECEVPFKPNGSKPVFCNNCFRSNKGSSDSRSFGGGNMGGSRYSDKPMFDAVCDKCGRDCKIPFQPREGKPVYCSNCFEDKNRGEGQRSAGSPQYPQFKEQFQALNGKLDRILRLLEPNAPVKAEPAKETPKKEVVSEVVSPEINVEDIIVDKMEDAMPQEAVKSKEKKKKAPKKTASAKKE